MLKKPTQPPNLSYFARERQILSKSPHWQTIAQWQREGLLFLRWGGSRDAAWVSLTAKGHAQVEAEKPTAASKETEKSPIT